MCYPLVQCSFKTNSLYNCPSIYFKFFRCFFNSTFYKICIV